MVALRTGIALLALIFCAAQSPVPTPAMPLVYRKLLPLFPLEGDLEFVDFQRGSDALDAAALEKIERQIAALKPFLPLRGELLACFDPDEVASSRDGNELSARRAIAVLRAYEAHGFKRDDLEIHLRGQRVLRTRDTPEAIESAAKYNRAVRAYFVVP
jgi:hypothetical protein